MWRLVILGILVWGWGPSSGVPDPETLLSPWEPSEMAKERLSSLPTGGSDRVRLHRLQRWVVSRQGLGLREAFGHSAPAAEVVAERRADCVGFALVFVGLAREAGLNVVFALEDRPPRALDRGQELGQTVLPEGTELEEAHMVAWLPIAGKSPGKDAGWAIDFSGVYRGDGRYRTISDRGAAAILWSNQGAFSYLEGRCGAARRWMTIARSLAPDSPSIEGNWQAIERHCPGPLASFKAAWRSD